MTLYLKNARFIDWKTLAFESAHMAVSPGWDGSTRFIDAVPHISEWYDLTVKGIMGLV